MTCTKSEKQEKINDNTLSLCPRYDNIKFIESNKEE